MKQNTPTTTIMVFARAPVPGRVKTRLIPALGEKGAAELHAALMEQTLKTASQLDDSAIGIYCQPDKHHPLFRQAAEHYKLTLHSQQGNDLGERMANAFTDNLPNYHKALVIGCDCPAFTPDDLRAAIQILDDQDAVIVPAHDGGYVLLGLSTFSPLIFNDIDWSTNRVLEQTTGQLDAAGLHWTSLDPKHDIDRPDDLMYCPEHLLTGVTNEMAR